MSLQRLRIVRLIVALLSQQLTPKNALALKRWLRQSPLHRIKLKEFTNKELVKSELRKFRSMDAGLAWEEIYQKVRASGDLKDKFIAPTPRGNTNFSKGQPGISDTDSKEKVQIYYQPVTPINSKGRE